MDDSLSLTTPTKEREQREYNTGQGIQRILFSRPIGPALVFFPLTPAFPGSKADHFSGYRLSTRELARNLLDQVPESKLLYVVAYLQGVTTPEDDETPNARTLAAIDEVDEMIRTGKGEHFEGSTADFFAQLAAEG